MIQTESTPNPNSLKFLSERTISSVGTEEFQKGKTDDLNNSFIKELLDFKGVELVLLAKNFLSTTHHLYHLTFLKTLKLLDVLT